MTDPSTSGSPWNAPQPGAPTYGAPPPGFAPPPGAPPPGFPGADPLSTDPSTSPSAPPLASFRNRLYGWLVDQVVFFLITIVLVGVPTGAAAALNWDTTFEACTLSSGEQGLCETPTTETVRWMLAGVGLGLLLVIVAWVFYYLRPIARTGQTLGKRMAGVRVVSTNTMQPPTMGGSLIRALVAYAASGAICYLGYLWSLWDDDRQTWHDKAADTVVIEH